MPADVAPGLLAVLAVLAFGTSLVNGAIGFGFGILSVNALALAFGPKVGIVVLSLVALPLASIQVVHHRSLASLGRRLASLGAGAVVGSLIGVPLLLILPGWALSIGLGVFTGWYAIDGLRQERAPLQTGTERAIAPFVGFGAGLTNGALGAAGPVLGTYLAAIGLRGREFAFGINLMFVAMGVVRAAILALTDQYVPAAVVTAAVLVGPAILGQSLGFRLKGRVSGEALQRVLLVILLVAAVNLVTTGIRTLPR